MPGIKVQSYFELWKNYEKYMTDNDKDSVLEYKVMETDANGIPTKMFHRFKMPMMSERELLLQCEAHKITEGPYAGRYLYT